MCVRAHSKVALVMAIVLFRDMGQIWQLVMAAMVTVLALCLHLHFKPHAFPRLQALEIMALSVSLLTFVLALLLLASGNGGSENATAELVVTLVIFLANALFVVVFILAMRSEAIKRVRGAVSAVAVGSTHSMSIRTAGQATGAESQAKREERHPWAVYSEANAADR